MSTQPFTKAQLAALAQQAQDAKQAEHARNVLKHLRSVAKHNTKRSSGLTNTKPKVARPPINVSASTPTPYAHPSNRNNKSVGYGPSSKSRAREGVMVNPVTGLEESKHSGVRAMGLEERGGVYANRQAKYRARKREEINARNREWMRVKREEVKAARKAGKKG